MMRALPILLLLLSAGLSQAQLPVELLGGNDRTTADVLWFRPFTDSSGKASPFLFFNRTRASVNYSNQTAFGTTLAVSYNLRSGIGFVFTGQFLNQGFYPKAGVQYFTRTRRALLFTWVTAELLQQSRVDWFVLSRWEPPLSSQLNLFTQLELLSVVDPEGYLSLTQRIRLGLGFPLRWQSGVGIDLGQAGKGTFTTSTNIGLFIRKEF
jgi:hypothetical protein